MAKGVYFGVKNFEPRNLPDGYTQVEYIETNGTQFIDTGFVPNQDTRIVCKAYFPVTTATTCLFGVRASQFVNNFSITAYSSYYRSYFNTTEYNFATTEVFDAAFEIDKNKNVTTLGGLYTTEATYASFTAPGNLYIFAMNNNGTTSFQATAKIYSFRIYDNDTLVRDFVPCKKTDGTIGLYDMAGGVFYANAGSGVFTAGAGAKSVAQKVKKMYYGAEGNIPLYDMPTTETKTYLTNLATFFDIEEIAGTLWDEESSGMFVANSDGEGYAHFKLTAKADMAISFKYGSYGLEDHNERYVITVAGVTVADRSGQADASFNYSGTLNAGEAIEFIHEYLNNGLQWAYISNMYVTVTNIPSVIKSVAKKVKKAYIGVGGVARLFFSGGELAYYGTATALSVSRQNLAATTVGDYALFGGGDLSLSSSNTATSTAVDAYNASLTRSTPPALSTGRDQLAATTVGNYALFGGGATASIESTVVSNVDAYNQSLTRSTPTALTQARFQVAATAVGNYALFGGGRGKTIVYATAVDAYNQSLTRSTPTALSTGRNRLAATTIGNYALFGGGSADAGASNVVDAYNQSLTRSTPTALTQARFQVAATAVGNYALFGGGSVSNMTASSVVDAYNQSLTRSTPTALSVTKPNIAATTVGNYALFGPKNGQAAVDVYDASLTRSTPTPPSQDKYLYAATTVGNYALFGGGRNSGAGIIDTVDVYTID